MLVALAHNDNGRSRSSAARGGVGAEGLATERQRLALLVPLSVGGPHGSATSGGSAAGGCTASSGGGGEVAAPPAALRRRHELGVCVATSTVVVERGRGPLCWRASVTLWELDADVHKGGKHAGQAEAVARHLVRRLLDGVGDGEAVVERSGVSGGGTTFFARKLLRGEEARVVRTFAAPAPLELPTAL